MKDKITTEIKLTNDYNEFISQYSVWHSKSELIMFTTFLLDYVFKRKFKYDAFKFSLGNNLKWNVNEFAKRNFARLSSTVLKNVNICVSIFGNINYSRILLMVLSNYYAGMAISAIFFSTSFCHAALVGTYVFNWIVGVIVSYFDSYKNTEQFIKMTQVLISLNDKLKEI